MHIENARINGFKLRAQLLSQRADFRKSRASSETHRIQHQHQLARVYCHKEIASQAIRQHKPRVLLRNAERHQLFINAEERFHLHAIGVRIPNFRRNDESRGRKIDVAAGFYRKRREAKFDHELFDHYGNVVESNGERLVFSHGAMSGRDDLPHQIYVFFRVAASRENLKRRAGLG